MRKIILIIGLLLALLLTACGPSNPEADSDSSQSYKSGSKIPVDENVYVITGEVIGPVNDVTRQVEPSKGSLSGPSCYGSSGCYGGTTGSFTGPIEAGKGFVRLRIQSAKPSTDLAPTGDVTILKTSDTKVTALLPGDVVSLKCRRQYENVAAVKDNESFNADEVAAWELDYCRLATPVIQVK